jgi:predicted phosphodiesterase
MRVAALYDVHGNLPALDAVLAELEQEEPDAIVFGGDIIAGPMPRETLERVRSLGQKAHLIRGNADRIALEFRRGLRSEGEGLGDWVGRQLTDKEVEFLETLPLTVTLDLDGLGPTCFCHATPRDDEEVFTERDPDGIVAEMLAGTEETTIVCGHTHMQVDRRVDRRRVVNAGSVGLSYDGAGAHWALLGPDVELRRTDYDREDATRLFREIVGSRSRESSVIDNLLRTATREEALDFYEQWAAEQRGAAR